LSTRYDRLSSSMYSPFDWAIVGSGEVSATGDLRRRLSSSKVYVGRKDNPSFGKCIISYTNEHGQPRVFASGERIFGRRCRSNLAFDRSVWTQQGELSDSSFCAPTRHQNSYLCIFVGLPVSLGSRNPRSRSRLMRLASFGAGGREPP